MAIKTCTTAFLLEGNNILLAMKKRGFGVGKWNGPGGKVMNSETLEAAMIREVEEEVGVSPLAFKRIGVLDFHYQGTDDVLSHIYICTAWDGEPTESEEMAPQWFRAAEIPYSQMWPDCQFWLPKVLAGKFVRGDFTFDANFNLTNHQVEVS